jgi:hypothetical protein
MMTTRTCDCPHEFPFCVCALGYTGESLAYHSRVASAIIGWPTTNYDPDALAAHNERMRLAQEERDLIMALDAQARPLQSAKPRVALGVDQSTIPPVDCIPCQEAKA